MRRRWFVLTPALATLAIAAPARADVTQLTQSVTATGSAEAKVVPANRRSNASIAAAVAAAAKRAVPAALQAAHTNALLYAQDAGLTLGSVVSVSDVSNSNGYIGPYGLNTFFGPFGPNKYCGTETRSKVKRVGNRVKVVSRKRVYTCVVPPYSSSALTVTYSAS